MIDYKDEILSFYYEKRQNFIEAAERHEQNKTHFNYDVMHEAMLELNTVKLLLQRLNFSYEEVEHVESDQKPTDTSDNNDKCDVYKDWFETEEAANQFIKDAKEA